MNTFNSKVYAACLAGIISQTAFAVDAPFQAADPYFSADGLVMYNTPPHIVRVDPTQATQGQYAPADQRQLAVTNASTTTVQINYIAAGKTDAWGQTCTTFPSNAKAAFNLAGKIWGQKVRSAVPIKIDACWATLSSDTTLGYSGALYSTRDFLGAPKANTWYPAALANALLGFDYITSSADDGITFNSKFSWYYGTDGKPPAGKYDLVSVALHEMGHGLGFSGTAKYTSGIGSYGSSGYPNIYDRFMEDGNGKKVTSYTSLSTALGSLYTSGNLWFNGANAKAANGNKRIKMYAPSAWRQGSSYSHLDYDTFKGTSNSLMVYAMSSGASQQQPGAVTLGILKDLGWKLW